MSLKPKRVLFYDNKQTIIRITCSLDKNENRAY